MNESKPDSVYFFGTCLVDLFYPEAGLAGMQLIEREKVRVIFPQGQSCCGQPAWNAGYRDEARAVAAAQLGLFSRAIPIVVPSASCAGMMKEHYPALFRGTPQEAQALSVAQRVVELTAFLVDVLDIRLEDLGEPQRVAIHSSCSALREMGVGDRIESLVGQLGQVEKVEQAYKRECCGFGGTFAVKQPEISGAMVADKTDSIRQTGADILVSQDCGCLMNIDGAFGKQEDGPRCLHIAEFLWERTRADD
ncbi:MAG: (Fe-S)-binding protein [Gammaproteobacteria bacterium]|jgi:L-lactate dehydrogenase complex protein LldE